MENSFFDKSFDPECIPLIMALNQLPGIKTVESCCGHLKSNYHIWFKCNNLTSLAILARVFSGRANAKWKLEIEPSEMVIPPFKTFCLLLTSKKPFKTWNEMYKAVYNAVGILHYFSRDEYKKYFAGDSKEKEEKQKKLEDRRNDCIRFTNMIKSKVNMSDEQKELLEAKIKNIYGYCTLDIIEKLKEEEKLYE